MTYVFCILRKPQTIADFTCLYDHFVTNQTRRATTEKPQTQQYALIDINTVQSVNKVNNCRNNDFLLWTFYALFVKSYFPSYFPVDYSRIEFYSSRLALGQQNSSPLLKKS